jgi:RNA polymerase Rpb8
LADDYDYVCYGKVYRFDEGVKGSADRVYVPSSMSPPLCWLQLLPIVAASLLGWRGCWERLLSCADCRSVYISYGGLLMNLEGSYRKLSKLAHDNVYLLIRK